MAKIEPRDTEQSDIRKLLDNSEKAVEAKRQEGMKAVLARLHARLSDPTELYKLHLKHYHMKPKDFRKRTKYLQLPPSIYQLYEQIVLEKCTTCSRIKVAPPRSKVSGLRATAFGDLFFLTILSFH